MKKTFIRLFAAVMSASLLTFAAGCQKNSNSEPSSAPSVVTGADKTSDASEDKTASSAPQKETDRQNSEKASSAEPSKDESVTSAEESSAEPSVESADESTEESVQQSAEESSEESSEASVEESSEEPEPTLADIVSGSWTYQHDTGYINMTLNTDGTVVFYATGQQRSWFGTWTAENDTVAVNISGGTDNYTYENDTLIYTGDSTMVFVRGTSEGDFEVSTEPDDEASESELSAAVIGTWSSDEIGMSLHEDGSVLMHVNSLNNSYIGTWRIEGSSVILAVMGGEDTFTYQNGLLVSSDGEITLQKD